MKSQLESLCISVFDLNSVMIIEKWIFRGKKKKKSFFFVEDDMNFLPRIKIIIRELILCL